MADIPLTNGEAYVFAKIDDKAVILRGTDNAHLATTNIRSDIKVTGDLGVGNNTTLLAEIHVSQSHPLIIIEQTSDHFLTLGVANSGDTTLIGFHDDKKLEIGPLAVPNTPNMPNPAMTIHNNGAVTIGEYHINPTADNTRPLNFETADISGELYVMGNDSAGSSSALIAVYGRYQGDGVLYAGQDASYGGGILYKGSDSYTNEVGNCVTDRVSLYRTNNGEAHPVISWGYGSSTAYTHGDLEVGGDLTVSKDVSGFVAKFHNTSKNNETSDGIIISCGPDLKADVTTDNTFIKFEDGNGDLLGKVTGDGSSQIALNNVSDRRLKRDIIPAEYGISELLNLEVVDFKWKSSGRSSTGFIAQQVEEVYPGVISKPSKPEEPYTMNYAGLSPLIVKAIQDQNKTIEDLKSRILELEKLK